MMTMDRRGFGAKTETAVKQFQTRNKISSDGIVGIKTWELLAKSDTTSVPPPVTMPSVPATNIKTFSKKKDGDTLLTPHFRVREFASKDGADKIIIDVNMVHNLQKIRDHFQKPITITSGFRTESHNTKVKGAKNSFHLFGQAFDIVVSGVTPR